MIKEIRRMIKEDGRVKTRKSLNLLEEDLEEKLKLLKTIRVELKI